jgi:hypothetical protein
MNTTKRKEKGKNKTKAPLNSTAKQQEVPPLMAMPRLEKWFSYKRRLQKGNIA